MTEGMGRAHYYFFKWRTLRPRSKAIITVLFDLRHLSFVLKPAAGVIIAVTKRRGGSVLFFNDLLASSSNDLLFHFSIEKIRSSIRWKGAFSYQESVRTFSLPWLPSPYAKKGRIQASFCTIIKQHWHKILQTLKWFEWILFFTAH